MTIRFAAATTGYHSVLIRSICSAIPMLAANDNRLAHADDTMMHEALRHFASHGLSAAERARDNAEKSMATGDRESYDWWLSICRSLDRRMAERLSSRHGSKAS